MQGSQLEFSYYNEEKKSEEKQSLMYLVLKSQKEKSKNCHKIRILIRQEGEMKRMKFHLQ